MGFRGESQHSFVVQGVLWKVLPRATRKQDTQEGFLLGGSPIQAWAALEKPMGLL